MSAIPPVLTPELLEGLLLIDKPAGITSFGCVQTIKRALGGIRTGHCGTLDPDARGLLLVLLGKATRTQERFLGLEKEYWFRGEFGKQTDTADASGSLVKTSPWEHITERMLMETLTTFVGDHQQIPPLYSALKHKGKPYYHYARKGQDVPRVPRSITIYAFSLLSFTPPFWECRVLCSRGTYVRTLVEDVAVRLGTCATLVELVRERIGPYRRQDALGLEQSEKFQESIQPVSPLA